MGFASLPHRRIRSLYEHGIILLNSADPEFTAAVPPGAPAGSERLFPFLVAIKNLTRQDIVAFTVLWKCMGWDGEIRVQKATPDRGLAAGSTSLVSIEPLTPTSVSSMLEHYLGQQKIEILIDAVRFADGTTVGPNESRMAISQNGNGQPKVAKFQSK